MEEIIMQESPFPRELEHLRANLSIYISQGMTSAYSLSLLAQACDFPNEQDLLAFTGIQARAHFAMAWTRRIEHMAKRQEGQALYDMIEHELETAAEAMTSVHEAGIISLIHDDLQLAKTAR